MAISTEEFGRRLLSGEVICKFSDPVAFDDLDNEDTITIMNQHLAFMNARIARTPNDSGFYLVMDAGSTELTKRSREVFSEVIRHYRPILNWVSIFMRAIAPDRPILGGDRFKVVDVYQKISDDPAMQNDLKRHQKAKGESIRKQLDSLIAELKKKNIIIETNANLEQFQFTAKIDLINEYLAFIVDHEPIAVDEEDAPKQGALI